MPKVVDAARVTTRVNTVWRTCSGCDQIKPLRRGVKRCATCTQVLERHALNGWEHAQRYAALIGRIEAWTLLIPDVSDAERLDHIRQALATFDQVVPAEAVG
jgi:hypothetical protein